MGATGKNIEVDVLRQFGSRQAVLVAWATRLRERGVPVAADIDRNLDDARVKLSSGCFPSCEIGCILNKAEAALISTDSSSPNEEVDHWMGLVCASMTENIDTEKLLNVVTVKVQDSACMPGRCQCT